MGAVVEVGAICPATRSLGPGLRAALWVQGCPLRCAGCLASGWLEFGGGRSMTVPEVVDELLSDPRVTGLTFSGGEPMAQAVALAEVIRRARVRRRLTLICFTGMRLESLRAAAASDGVASLLGEVDVLIDGPYVARLDDGRGLRGSSNQRVHHLTERLREADAQLRSGPRSAEIRISGNSALLVGVPPAEVLKAFEQATSRLTGPAPTPVVRSHGGHDYAGGAGHDNSGHDNY
jgi:anaerobic ribonucleoside-triphosphate reductase activating protein